MATRHQPISHRHGGGGAAAIPKPKGKNAGDEGKNRRALGDIGNLVASRAAAPEGKPLQQQQVSRPITRSFGAQLLANAQAAAAANKEKFCAVQKPKAKEVAKPTPPPQSVIEISPDTAVSSKKTIKKSLRKKVHTLTSVLTARSKSACDIDSRDTENQLAVVEYVEDLYKFYKDAETSALPHDYMSSQVEINAKMRAILADWLIEVHSKFELMPESLYLTFHIIDRYLSSQSVLRRELQLVGVSAMLIACKYEEIWAPEVNDFIAISDQAYTREQILRMEKGILNKLEWSLTVPTPYVFLARFVKAAMCDKEMEHMVYFFAELGLMQYAMVTQCPSMLAAAAVYATRCTLKKAPLWTDTLRCHTGFEESQLLDCVEVLVKAHANAPMDKLKFVYKKYSGAERGMVALRAPAVEMMERMRSAAK